MAQVKILKAKDVKPADVADGTVGSAFSEVETKLPKRETLVQKSEAFKAATGQDSVQSIAGSPLDKPAT